MAVRIHIGDCRQVLKTLPDESVQCVVTSPPYFGLRDYGVDGQIGLESSPVEFVQIMVDVFRDVRRVLRSNGTLWLNLGDSYAGSGRGGHIGNGSSTLQGGIEHEQECRKARGSQLKPGLHGTVAEAGGIGRAWTPPPAGLKQKDLIGIPWRVAFALQADGWYLRQDIIWNKPNPMPESVRDRCTKAHEYLFLMSKSERYYYDSDAIRETRTSDEDANGFRGGCYTQGNIDNNEVGKRKTVGNKKIKIPGGWDRGEGAHGTIHRDGRTSAEYQEAEVKAGRNKRSVWEIATSPFPDAHFATFPPALVEPCILAGCPTGGFVLDPFGGAGTTGLVAERLQRDSILIELNESYAEMAKRRIDRDGGMFADVALIRHEQNQSRPVVPGCKEQSRDDSAPSQQSVAGDANV